MKRLAPGAAIVAACVLASVCGDRTVAVSDRRAASPANAPPTVPTSLYGFSVIGHRGASLVAPENTLLALSKAFDLGATVVEIDVHLSRDGIPVVIHDETLNRTTNGTGVVAKTPLDALKRLDAGAWMTPAFAGQRIPTLREVLDIAKGRGRVLIDPKQDGMGSAIARVFRDADVPLGAAILGTWEESQAADFAAHLPGALILNSLDEGAPEMWDEPYFAARRTRAIRGFEISRRWPAEFVAAAHAHRMPVYAYTINDEPTMRDLIEIGIDGIETDDPALLARVARDLNTGGSPRRAAVTKQ